MATGKGQGGGVSETMESARRWSGYVCPDCRFVFRVPRDHDGKGIVCPSCRRMLRIPTSADVPPPLMEQRVEEVEKRVLKKRRRNKADAAGHAWEQEAKGSRSSRSEKRWVRLMLIGGATLFPLIVAGVMVFMNRGAKAVVRSGAEVTPQGSKIHRESRTGWSEISWERFLTSKPVTGHVFRVTLSPVEYYNFGYADESKWQSYQLTSPNGEHSIYGYVEKGSALHRQIRANVESRSVSLMLSLKFPADANSASQVEIERFVAEGWVEGETP